MSNLVYHNMVVEMSAVYSIVSLLVVISLAILIAGVIHSFKD